MVFVKVAIIVISDICIHILLVVSDKRTESECRAIWHLYLHPDINKSPLTIEETEKLKNLTQKYKSQNWNQITAELESNRSPLNVCRYYFRTVHHRYKKGEFTFAEDKKLIETINMYKIGNYIQWNKVAKHFENRTRAQIHHRYTYFLTQESKKRGRFTKAEDIMLLICVDRLGRNFKKCMNYIPDRSMMQLKARYANNLQGALKKSNWTVEDDKTIWEHVQSKGPIEWGKLVKVLNRSRGQIRQRYLRIKSHLESGLSTEISQVPRRSIISRRNDNYVGDYECCR